MRTLSLQILAFLILFASYRGEAEDHLQGISENNLYTVEICFREFNCFVQFDTTKELRGYTDRITYRLENLQHKRFGDLVNALKQHSRRESKPIDVSWSIVIREIPIQRDLKDKEICTCCFDAWGLNGYSDGVPVTFSGDIGIWLREYLGELFEVKNTPVGTTPSPPVSPNAALWTQFNESITAAPLLVALIGVIIYFRKGFDRKKLV